MTPLLRASTLSALAAFLVLGLAPSTWAQTPNATVKNGDGNIRLQSFYNGGLLAPGTSVTDGTENDSIPAEGAGTRMMWYPAKSAFRAGRVFDNSGNNGVDGDQFWNAANVGSYSAAFGKNTKASGEGAVAMGSGTIANDIGAVALGRGTSAESFQAVAMGSQTTARGAYTTAMGARTFANGDASVAMGLETTADGFQVTVMGRGTTAKETNSLSIGQCNSSNTSGDNTLFVAGNGSYALGNCDSRSDALVLDKNGTLSISGAFEAGLTNSTYAGHFRGDKNTTDEDVTSHVGLVENTNTGSDADGLAIQAGPTSTPGGNVNYLTFFDGDGDAVGSIEGDGSGGITQVSAGADFAEELPVAAGAPRPEPTELVGVRGGTVSLDTEGANRIMIASSAPAVTGNSTPQTRADDDRRLAVAFIGQVPVRVRGSAEIGDLIIASGKNDGTARAVDPADYRREEHGPVAGQAWSSKPTEAVGDVTVAVGLGRSGAVAERLESQRSRIADLKAENTERNQKIERLEERVTKLETQVGDPSMARAGGAPSVTVLGGVLALLALGGAFGTGLLAARRS